MYEIGLSGTVNKTVPLKQLFPGAPRNVKAALSNSRSGGTLLFRGRKVRIKYQCGADDDDLYRSSFILLKKLSKSNHLSLR